jgi:hypothetical protein
MTGETVHVWEVDVVTKFWENCKQGMREYGPYGMCVYAGMITREMLKIYAAT